MLTCSERWLPQLGWQDNKEESEGATRDFKRSNHHFPLCARTIILFLANRPRTFACEHYTWEKGVILFYLAHAALQHVKLQRVCRNADGRLSYDCTQLHLHPPTV